MQESDIEIDMNVFRLPLAKVREGETCEMRIGGPDWKFGFRHGRVWLNDGKLVGRLADTTEVRVPEDWVRTAIDNLVSILVWGRRARELEAVIQDEFNPVLDSWCCDLIGQPNGDGERDPATFERVRRMLCLAAVRKALPSKPLSEIVVGYHALNTAGEIVLESTCATEAWDHAHHVEKTGFAGVGVVFADGSVRYDDDLVRLPGLPGRDVDPGRRQRSRSRR